MFKNLYLTTCLFFCPFSEQSLAINDPSHTISTELTSEEQTDAIDHFTTFYREQNIRHEKVSIICRNKNINKHSKEGRRLKTYKVTVSSCNEFLDNLLIELDYLSDNYARGHKLFGEVTSHRERVAYIKSVYLHVLGTIHSILNPNHGGNLAELGSMFDPNSLSVDLTSVRVSNITRSLLHMHEAMGDDLFAYELVRDGDRKKKPRKLYQVSIIWTAIFHDLSSLGLITNPSHELGTVMKRMQASHYQAFHGIQLFQIHGQTETRLKYEAYMGVVESSCFPDLHRIDPSEEETSTFLGNDNALTMSLAEASAARDMAQKFLIDHGYQPMIIDWNILNTLPARINATESQIQAQRAEKFL